MPHTAIYLFRAADGAVPLRDWLNELEEREPRAYRKCLQRILLLEQLGSDLRRPLADSLRDGIRELRAKAGAVNYRILYSFCGQNLVCLSHGLTKKGAVPAADIDLALRRKKLVEADFEKYTADWEG